MRFARTLTALGTLALLSAPALAQGCPMCKQALEESSPNAIQGFYYSILLLISLPLLMAGTFVFLLHRAAKRREGPPPAPPAA